MKKKKRVLINTLFIFLLNAFVDILTGFKKSFDVMRKVLCILVLLFFPRLYNIDRQYSEKIANGFSLTNWTILCLTKKINIHSAYQN
jgi:hypothetical protein